MKKFLLTISILLIAAASYAQTTAEESTRKLCHDTGGTYYGVEDCPECPKGAVCESCFIGCTLTIQIRRRGTSDFLT